MSQTQNFETWGVLTPNPELRLGRILLGGQLTATITSKSTGQHMSLTFQSKLKTETFPRWKAVSLLKASHLFIGTVGGDKIGTYYPNSKRFYAAKGADPARIWAARQILRASTKPAGVIVLLVGTEMDYVEQLETSKFTIVSANVCGKCGRELTDPLSVQRGFGPTCWGSETGSTHQSKQHEEAPVQLGFEQTRRDLQRVMRPEDLPAMAEIVNAQNDPKGRAVPKTFAELAGRIGQ